MFDVTSTVLMGMQLNSAERPEDSARNCERPVIQGAPEVPDGGRVATCELTTKDVQFVPAWYQLLAGATQPTLLAVSCVEPRAAVP